jgi:hypothetical protein
LTTEVRLDKVYEEAKRMRLKLKSIEKSLDSLVESLIPEEKISSEEMEELEVLKHEAEQGKCVPLEEVLKKHGAKRGMNVYNSAQTPKATS